MPTFCRHNRFVENCPICSKKERFHSGAASGAGKERTAAAPRRAPGAKPTRSAVARRAASNLRVRRVARAVDDGYGNELVPGLRSTEDARRLAEELAFATARLDELATEPPGLYAEAANAEDPEEGLWLAFLIAWLSPLEGTEDPFASINAARVPWATGELPDLSAVETGPRSGYDAARAEAQIAAYRAWAARSGSQLSAYSSEPTPQRRFDRAMERLRLPAFPRGPRYELLVLVGHLGLADLEPWTIAPGEVLDPATTAAKRVFGIGDTVNLQRRAGALAGALEIPVAALDLGLQNWARPPGEPRITAGSVAEADGEGVEALAEVLGAPVDESH